MAPNRTSAPSRRSQRRGGLGPTIVDVARAAGVSSMTVSRVINRDASVLAATRAKVDEVITAIGYVPNPAARRLAGGRPCRLALLYRNPSAAFLSEFLVGALEAARKHDLEMVVEQWIDQPAAELIARLVSHRIDGVILPPPLCDHAELIEAAAAVGLPIAQIATGRPAPDVVAVTIDDAAAAHAVATYLIGAGHRRIGFIEGDREQTASALRRAGYEAAIREAGISADPALIRPGDFTYRGGLSAAAALLTRNDRPTAIFASNDDMAAGVIAAAHGLGLQVPADLSVCGFDDTAIATTIWPQLTTVRQPIAEMASRAVSLLSASTTARDRASTGVGRHERLPFTIVERQSVASPRRA